MTTYLNGVPVAVAPADHKATHQDTGSDEVNVGGLAGDLADTQDPKAHKASHQNAGGDEISVAGLSGALADSQTPSAHKASHQNAGGDEVSVAGLSGQLADDQHVVDAEVVSAAKTVKLDDFTAPDDNVDLDASGAKHGLMPKADKTKIDTVDTNADVTGANAPQAHKDSHDPIDGGDKLDTAVPVKVAAANAIGSSHSFSRADHVHEREHAIYTLETHKATHQNGGGDEVSVAGLSGQLADDQHVVDAEVLLVAAALVHAARHQNGGADEISVAALSGLLADDQHVLDAEVLLVASDLAHAARHEIGGADSMRWTLNKLLLGAGAGADPTLIDVPGGGVEEYSAGDTLVTKTDAEGHSLAGSFTKVKEIMMGNSGTLRVKFDLRAEDTLFTVHGRVYKNGVAVGTDQSTANESYQTYSEDIAGWSVGDLLQLYVWGGGTSYEAYYRNFRAYSGTRQTGFDILLE